MLQPNLAISSSVGRRGSLIYVSLTSDSLNQEHEPEHELVQVIASFAVAKHRRFRPLMGTGKTKPDSSGSQPFAHVQGFSPGTTQLMNLQGKATK